MVKAGSEPCVPTQDRCDSKAYSTKWKLRTGHPIIFMVVLSILQSKHFQFIHTQTFTRVFPGVGGKKTCPCHMFMLLFKPQFSSAPFTGSKDSPLKG